METAQVQWFRSGGWQGSPATSWRPDVAFAFGSRNVLSDPTSLAALRVAFPDVPVVGCSTAGEIFGTNVQDGTLSVTAVRFEHTRLRFTRRTVPDRSTCREAARDVARALAADDLVSVFVLSDGLRVYGPDVVAGLGDVLPPKVVVTGGMAADGSEFCETVVLSERGLETHAIVAIGFYGDRLRVGHGSAGGWDPFGPFRRVTRASGNVLHELDGQSALALYKRYLGEHAASLPGAALLFPLSVARSRNEQGPGRRRGARGHDRLRRTGERRVPAGRRRAAHAGARVRAVVAGADGRERGAGRGEPREGPVPRDAGARAAEPAGADRDGAGGRGAARFVVRRGARSGTPRAPGAAAGRRSAGHRARGARHAGPGEAAVRGFELGPRRRRGGDARRRTGWPDAAHRRARVRSDRRRRRGPADPGHQQPARERGSLHLSGRRHLGQRRARRRGGRPARIGHRPGHRPRAPAADLRLVRAVAEPGRPARRRAGAGPDHRAQHRRAAVAA